MNKDALNSSLEKRLYTLAEKCIRSTFEECLTSKDTTKIDTLNQMLTELKSVFVTTEESKAPVKPTPQVAKEATKKKGKPGRKKGWRKHKPATSVTIIAEPAKTLPVFEALMPGEGDVKPKDEWAALKGSEQGLVYNREAFKSAEEATMFKRLFDHYAKNRQKKPKGKAENPLMFEPKQVSYYKRRFETMLPDVAKLELPEETIVAPKEVPMVSKSFAKEMIIEGDEAKQNEYHEEQLTAF